MADDSGIEQQIVSLRRIVAEKPRNGRAMAKLSCALVDRVKELADDAAAEPMREEALIWARRSVEVAPSKPFGLMALSTASPSHEERMEALRSVIEMECGDDAGDEEKKEGGRRQPRPRTAVPAATVAVLLVRLLVEPRDEEARTLRDIARRTGRTTIGSASPKHPSRRELDKSEKDLYERVQQALDSAALYFSQCDQSGGRSVEKERIYCAKNEYRLGVLLRKMNPQCTYRPKSRMHFERVVKALPNSQPIFNKARFWLATFSADVESSDDKVLDDRGLVAIDRCPEEYVVSLYSTFAAKFDDLLINKLKYETPTLLRRLVDSVVGASTAKEVWAKRGADLGCGTGLSGIAFRDCTDHLTGVDLSPEMVEKARERGCYDHLVVGDIESILHSPSSGQTSDSLFDIMFACDVLVYIGDLRSVFSAVRQRLNHDGGIFAFSTEHLEEHEAGDNPFILRACARFAHKKSYIAELIKENRFHCNEMETKTIRKNQGKDVKGLLAVMTVSGET